jgi:bifunctional non-homologous end joining protein LigD
MALEEYARKRDFGKTPEPRGKKLQKDGFSFVVQKHAASHLHYDFRLELDGVLLSWAIPKGPSLNPAEKRLAMQTEDHPVEYGGFEGVIPEGEYGGGSVVVWDNGTWEPEGDPRKTYAKGRLRFKLHGKKLQGTWNLVRMPKNKDRSKRSAWLLIKSHDDAARAAGDPEIVDEAPESVLTGRSVEEVGEQADRVWRSKAKRTAGSKSVAPAKSKTSKKRASTKRTAVSEESEQGSSPSVQLTNPDKVLFSEQGITKRQLADYYMQVAEWMLPYVAGRPLTLVRCPEGHKKQCFYQKHVMQGSPKMIYPVDVADEAGPHTEIRDVLGLVALVQIGVLEIHAWGSHSDDVEHPDLLVFDFDPGPDVKWPKVIEAAHEMRARLSEYGLESFPKTTGGKGLHLVVPIEPRTDWDETKAFCKTFVEQMTADSPHAYTTNPLKAQRRGKIFLDYLRNGRGATAIVPFSTRARDGAPVATPISWDEVTPRLKPEKFTLQTVPDRLRKLKHDPWAEFDKVRHAISLEPRKPARKRKVAGGRR